MYRGALKTTQTSQMELFLIFENCFIRAYLTHHIMIYINFFDKIKVFLNKVT